MSTSLGTLVIDLKANTASFSEGMDKMSALSAKTATDIKRSLEKIAVAGLAMGAAVATGTAAIIEKSVTAITSLGRLSQAAGTTAENFSVLAYAAKRSHLETEDLAKGLEKLSRSAFQAQNGNSALSNVFARLGVSILDSNHHLRDSSDIFTQIAVKFSQMQNGAGKTALAMSLFGKGGAQLIPMLNDYGQHQAEITDEAKKFGLVIGSDVVGKAGAFHEMLVKLKAAGEGFRLQLTASVLPALIALGQKLGEIGSHFDISKVADEFGKKLTAAVDKAGDALQFAAKHAQALKIALEGLIALQLGKIAIPFIAQLAAGGIGNAEKGLTSFIVSALGIKKLIPIVVEFAGWLKYIASFTALLASEEGIASAAAYSLGVGFAAIGGWVTVAIAAIVGLGIVLYKFRDATFSLKGTTYELRDVWNAAWIAMGKGTSWLGGEVGKLVDWMKRVWSGFIDWFANLSFVRVIKGWFDTAVKWAAEIAGKLTPQWAIDSLNEAKQQRLDASKPPPTDKPAPPASLPAPDTSGLGKTKHVPKDVYGDELAKLNQAIIAQASYLAVIDATPEKLEKVSNKEKADNIIVELNNKLHDEGKKKLDEKQKAEIRLRVSIDETLKSLTEYGRELVSQQHSADLTIQQTRALAAANLEGDEAVRKTTISNAILALTYGKTAAQIKYMTPELERLKALMNTRSNTETVAAANKELFSINQEIDSRRGLASAMLQGVDAYRQASLAAKLYALDQEIANTSDAEAKKALSDKREAIVKLNQAELAEATAAEAVRLQSPLKQYEEETKALNKAVEALKDGGKHTLTYAEQLGISATRQEQLNKAIENTISLLLAEGSAKSGMAAFFLKMQQSARTTASVIYEALTSAVDKASDNLSRLLTGQKASWAAMFRDIAQQMLNSEIKTGLQKGIGAIGKHFGVDIGGLDKPDGSQSKPFYVRGLNVSGGVGKAASASGDNSDDSGDDSEDSGTGIFGKLKGMFSGIFGKLGGLFSSLFGGGGGGGFGSILSSLGGLIPHESGGDISPSSAYLVGEKGPEILEGASGHITDNATSKRILNASGDTNIYHIDARNSTDPVMVEQRLRRALQMSHDAAVQQAGQVQKERARRTVR